MKIGQWWSPNLEPAEPTEQLIAQGLSTLTAVDRPFWEKKMERVLRNPNSLLWIHVPKDGIAASTLDVVGRLWFRYAGVIIVGIVLLSLDLKIAAVTGLAWFLIGLGIVTYGIGVSRAIKASKARRAWRHGLR